MRRIISAVCMAALGAAVVAAQGAGTPDQTGKPAQAGKSQTTTVVGCVAPGTGVGQFQLTNATMASAAGTERKSEAGAANAGATYMLTGGENLKAHVGHKVEVTGDLTRMTGQDRAGAKAAEGAKPSAGAAGADVRGTIAVSNVKMVSTTCP